MVHRCVLPCLALLWLGGCAGREDGAYPSLAPRPIEALGFAEPAAPPARSAPADPALDQRIAAARAALAKARSAFDSAAARADRAAVAARGQPVGSDRWLEAQTALSELDALRADSGEVVTTLEDMAIERRAALAPVYPTLDEALASAKDQAGAQTSRIDAIQTALPSG